MTEIRFRATYKLSCWCFDLAPGGVGRRDAVCSTEVAWCAIDLRLVHFVRVIISMLI